MKEKREILSLSRYKVIPRVELKLFASTANERDILTLTAFTQAAVWPEKPSRNQRKHDVGTGNLKQASL